MPQSGGVEGGAGNGQTDSLAAKGRQVNPAAAKSLLTYRTTPVVRAEHGEGSLTRVIEQQTAKIPSDAFLFAALLSMGASFALEIADRQRSSRFVGMWVAPLLIMGVYNKLVKVLGFR